MNMNEEARQRMLCAGLSDKDSGIYKGLMQVLRDCQAADARAKQNQPYVVVPFFVDPHDVVALERQFDISIKVHGSCVRMRSTPRVAAMVFLLESALIEHASACNRNVLLIDGDVMSVAALNVEGKIVERTHATSRLVTGYFMEDELVRKYTTARGGCLNYVADMLVRQLREGGGENYWPSVREDGPRVDYILVNHFKSPLSAVQLAWLAHKRGAVVLGAVPFQVEMLTDDEGELECFPGKFYVDRVTDTLTLVPRSDATMSISHPYSWWCEILKNNTIVAGGKEYLCEKYKSLQGVVYYSLSPVGGNYEAPETLRTHYFDSSMVGITEFTFPKVKLSSEGIPIGFERGKGRILTSRLEKAMSRLMTSANDIVTPSEAFTAFMDYNNTVVNSLDTVKIAERMTVEAQEDASLAVALHVNWTRHAARGTFNVLLDAIKLRHSLKDAALYKFAYIAISAWWSKPRVGHECQEGQLPAVDVLDWCGNDFSVVMEDADPWIEFRQEAGKASETFSRFADWLPKPPLTTKGLWYENLLARAKGKVQLPDRKRSGGGCSAGTHVSSNPMMSYVSVEKSSLSSTTVSVVGEFDRQVSRSEHDLTAVKQTLRKKMLQDQGAITEHVPDQLVLARNTIVTPSLPHVPVVEVEPVSAIQSDINMCNKGPFERDVVTTGYRIAEVDVDKHAEGVFSINDAKRAIPAQRWVRRPKVDAGVEGKRVSSQAALMGALFKRNIGVPSNRGTVDLDALPVMAVDRVIQVCYREDWQEILQKHLDTGLWEPNQEDVEDFLANMEEKKARRMLDEFFLEGMVDLTRWQLMAKGKIKTNREVDGNQKVDHSQTIMYLENSSTNAMYSSMLRRFKEVLDEMLRPEVCINAQRSDEEHELWYNSLESVRRSHKKTYSYNADIRCYDRSQEHVALRIDLQFYRKHGLGPERLKIWEQTHGPKKAVAMMYGVVLSMVLGGVSGLWKTLLRNSLVNLAATVISTGITRRDVVMMDIKGDDGDFEFSRPIQVETSVEKMSLTFNLSAKFFTSDVRYMCKSFRIRVNGWWYFIADPWARAQSLCTPLWVGNHEDNLIERWESLRSDLRHYDNGILVDQVAEAAQTYYQLEKPLYDMARGLSAVAASRSRYCNFFHAPELVG